MNKEAERQEFRLHCIDKLRDIRNEAYSGLTAIEYDAIGTALHFIKMMHRLSQIKENNNEDSKQ